MNLSTLSLAFLCLCQQGQGFLPSTRQTPNHRIQKHILLSSTAPVSKPSTETSSATSAVTIPNPKAKVVWISGSAPSGYGSTSPEPNPTWAQVADQLARRLPHFSQSIESGDTDQESTIATASIPVENLTREDLVGADVVVALGVASSSEEERLAQVLSQSSTSASSTVKALLCDQTCGQTTQNLQFAGSFQVQQSSWQSIYAQLLPWTQIASHQRLLKKTETLLARKSSEDYLFAALFTIHSLVTPIDVVASDINPSWEKGIVRNVQEFKTMLDCCAPQIQAAITDPKSKQAIDQLNSLDLRDQVGSYRVIVSNETPQLEDFTLCILQQNNCFQCNSPILTQPKVPLLQEWRGKPLTRETAKQILMGHLDHPNSADCSQKKPWSWKIVVGANPAYDAFPLQHQIFYPSGGKMGSALWYDPVFCVETLQGELVWCKRHYRCTPRKHWSGKMEGAWTLTTLDNGMVSEEHWTTVDAADDLSWAVLHYSGAARRAGQSYVGALLCTPTGEWPNSAKEGPELERIRTAFRNCDLELWELFGGNTQESYMWSKKYTDWAAANAPPLEPIGDISITTWRKRERERLLKEQKQQQ